MQLFNYKPQFSCLASYYYLGWQATLNNKPILLDKNKDELMKITLPEQTKGALSVTFSATPARKIGIYISIASALFWIIINDIVAH